MPSAHFCLVAACDAKYARHAQALFASAAPVECDKFLLDLGLEPEQRAIFTGQGIKLLDPALPYDFPARRWVEESFPGFKAMVLRPELDRILPDYDVILWIDSDAWLQNPDAAIELMREAENNEIAVVPELDRAYVKFSRRFGIWHIEHETWLHCFGTEIADRMRLSPTLNSGVFAIRRGSRIWSLWREALKTGLMRLSAIDGKARVIEQLAFNLAVRDSGVPFRPFPATYNWLASLARPAFDPARGLFVEPNPPHDPLHVVHLSMHVLDNPVNVPLAGFPRRMVPGVRLTFEGRKALIARFAGQSGQS